MISTVVVLPAPFGPSSATTSPAPDRERDAVDHRPIAVALDQAIDDCRLAGRAVTARSGRTGVRSRRR